MAAGGIGGAEAGRAPGPRPAADTGCAAYEREGDLCTYVPACDEINAGSEKKSCTWVDTEEEEDSGVGASGNRKCTTPKIDENTRIIGK